MILKRLASLFILVFLCLSNRSFSESFSEKTAAQIFVEKAQNLNLSSDPEWRKILFYQRKYFSDRRGMVDGSAFYLSSEGKYNLNKEMIATINAFFSATQGNNSAQCKFPRRLKWLKSKLDDDKIQFPTVPCERFENWLTMVNPKGVVFVFSSFYINNPSSMFGHTFLRIEGSNHALTDYGVNFAANTDTNNMLVYTYKGVTGGFEGRFSVLPYYLKVQEYNNSESRDLWEYELNLDQDQIDNMMRSLWEVGDNRIDYYYIDENCSYVLLALLDTTDTKFNFTDQFFSFVNPPDTLRVVTRYPDLVKKTIFRPSAQRRFRARYQVLNSSERDFFTEVADERIKPDDLTHHVSKESAAAILTAVSEYIDYREHIAGTADSKKYPVFRKQVFNARARLQVVSPPLDIKVTDEDHPENGVFGSRMGLFYSYSSATQSAVDYEIRPVLHDLQSPAIGYSQESQIEFLNTSVRYETPSKMLYLKRLSLLKVRSTPALYAPFFPISWAFETTMEQDDDCQKSFFDATCRRYFLGGGSGLSIGGEIEKIAIHGYGLPTAQISYMDSFGFEALMGLEGGFIVTLYKKFVFYTSTQWFKRYSISQSLWRNHLNIDASLSAPILNSFEGRLQYSYNFETSVWRFGAGIYWYFF